MTLEFPIFITVNETMPIGTEPRQRKINLTEVETFSSVGMVTTAYLKSGRKIENIQATDSEIETLIYNARTDLFSKIAKYSR